MPLQASIVGTPIGSVVGTVTCLVNGTIESNVAVPGPQGPVGPQGPAGPAGADEWGQITGTLSNQTDLQAALDAKYNASNPAGYQTASQVAAALAPYAPLVSPGLSGVPTTPTAATGTSTTQIASTAFVQQELLAGTAVARNLEVQVRNQSGSTITAGTIVYISGATGNLPLITKAQANSDSTSAQTIGFVKADIANNGTGYVIIRGILDAIDTHSLSEGVQLYLSPTTAGTWTTSKPSAPEHLVYVGIVIRSHPNQGTILVAVQNGYELDEIHDVAIASKTNNDLLAYESSTNLWKNKSFSTLGLATQSFVTGQGYITSSALTPYLLSSTAASTYYPLSGNPSGFLTSASLTGYATQSWVTAGFYPLTGNPSGFLTSAPVTSVAGRTGAITLSNTDISGLGTMATATATDYLSKAGNLSGLASTSTARTNLGLGSMATATATDYLDKAGNLSGLANTATARTNLGLGTASTLASSAVAQTANNLSDLASASTARANLGLTALATASFATVPEALAGTSTSAVVNPLDAFLAQMAPAIYSPTASGLTAGTSGAGASSSVGANGGGVNSPTTAVGYAVRSVVAVSSGQNITGAINWSRPIAISGRFNAYFQFQTQGVFRFNLGAAAATLGTPSVRSIGIRFGASATNTLSALVLEVHNGTTLTSVTSSFTPTFTQLFDAVIYSDGSGNVTLYVNGTAVATTSAGPTTAGGLTNNILQVGVENISTSTTYSSCAFLAIKYLVN